jgi:integrase
MTLPAFPYEVKKGNSIVKIYRYSNAGYDEFKLSYYAGGRRKMETFAEFDKAKARAVEINGSVTNGDSENLLLTGKDRLVFTRAVEALQPSGVSLDVAAIQFAEAKALLGGVSLMEAAQFYAKRHANTITGKTVAEAVAEFIVAKTAAKRSDRHLQDIKYRLGKFRDSFCCDLADVGELGLRKFLDGLKLSPRSQNNFRTTIISFFRWAKKKKYLPSDWDEFASIETVEDGAGEIEIFTPEELAALLTHADAKLIPFLVIGAFAGLRSSEFCRLDWQDIGKGEGKFIEVKAANARKTRQRRLVPISESLKAWLKPFTKKSGLVWEYKDTYLYELLEVVTAKAKVPWKNNGLRHSFISYRVAETEDVNKVALEAGNSPQMIFRNYRELVTPKDAARWFSIKPVDSSADKVTPLQEAA